MKWWRRLLWYLKHHQCLACGCMKPHQYYYVDWPYAQMSGGVPGYWCMHVIKTGEFNHEVPSV